MGGDDPIIAEIEDPFVLQQLGIRFIEEGQPENAIAALRKSLSLLQGNAETHMWLGAALRLQGDPDAAETALRRALEINPRLTEAHNWLGLLYYEQAEPERAIEEFRAALQDASYPRVSRFRVYSNLGLAYYGLGRLAEAVTAFSDAMAMDPSPRDPLYVTVRLNLAQGLLESGRTREALLAIEDLEVDGLNAARAHLLRGTAYRDLADPVAARRHLEQVMRLAPGSEFAARALEILEALERHPGAATS